MEDDAVRSSDALDRLEDLAGPSDRHDELLLDAVNRRGRPVQLLVTTTPLKAGGEPDRVAGVIIVMDEQAAAVRNGQSEDSRPDGVGLDGVGLDGAGPDGAGPDGVGLDGIGVDGVGAGRVDGRPGRG